jgi:hypothetical protein
MTRTPLDPSLLGASDPARDQALLDAIVQSLRPSARALAARVFAREVLDAVDGPSEHALASLAKDHASLDFAAVREGRARALLDSLSEQERAAIDEHGEDIASTLARAWVDLWSRAAAESDGALRVDRAVPDQRAIDESWSECAAMLGLDRAEADGLVLAFCQRIRSEGATVSLPLGLAIDGRASDLWLHREGARGALPEEVVRSGEQLRAPAISLDEARKRRGG